MDGSSLIDLIRNVSYLRAGGGKKSIGEKIGGLLSGVGSAAAGVGQGLNTAIKTPLEIEKAKVDLDKERAQTAALQSFSYIDPTTGSISHLPQPGFLPVKTSQAANIGAQFGLKSGSTGYINPTTREYSETQKPGFIKVSSNTGATIAAQPTKEEATTQRQIEMQTKTQNYKEAGENRAKNKEALQQLNDITANLETLKELSKQIPGGVEGGQRSLMAKTGQAYPEAATYDRNKSAAAVGLYRALTGDTKLSDADAASRALPLLPDLYQNDEQRKALWNYIDKRLLQRRVNLEKGISSVEPLSNSGMQMSGLDLIFKNPKISQDLKDKASVLRNASVPENDIIAAILQDAGISQ